MRELTFEERVERAIREYVRKKKPLNEAEAVITSYRLGLVGEKTLRRTLMKLGLPKKKIDEIKIMLDLLAYDPYIDP